MSTFVSLHVLTLTDKQASLWKLRSLNLSISEIASRLGISRQAVHRSLQVIDMKVYKALTSVATACKVEIRRIDVKKGFLVGWSPWLGVDVYITFSVKNGIQVWFKHKGNCKECSLRDECRRILLSEAEERGINLPKDERIEPSQLAEIFFKELLKG